MHGVLRLIAKLLLRDDLISDCLSAKAERLGVLQGLLAGDIAIDFLLKVVSLAWLECLGVFREAGEPSAQGCSTLGGDFKSLSGNTFDGFEEDSWKGDNTEYSSRLLYFWRACLPWD